MGELGSEFYHHGEVELESDEYFKLYQSREGSYVKVEDHEPNYIVTFPFDEHKVRVSTEESTELKPRQLVTRAFRKI